jgi:hypothetical protein
MPRPNKNVLKRHAEEMGSAYCGGAYGVGFTIDPITAASLFLGLLQMAVRCWFSGPTEGAARVGRRTLREEHNGVRYSSRLVRRLQERVRRHFAKRGHELTSGQVNLITDDILERERRAGDEEVACACAEGWCAKPGE